MTRQGAVLAVYAALAIWGSYGQGIAQEPAADANPLLPVPGGAAKLPPWPGASPMTCPLQDRNESLLCGHPLLDPPLAQPGWFAALEVDVLGPAIKQRVIGQVPLGSVATDVALPTATLGWTGAPRIEVGYRLPAAVGELAVSYRLLATEGTGNITGFDAAGDGALKSRLDANVIFLDYSSREFSLWPGADMKAHVGVCLPSIFFDSQAVGALREERFINYYFGAGPHLGFDFWQQLPVAGLDLYTRLEGTDTVGHVQQRFEESLASVGSGSSFIKRVREVPMLHLDVGVSYTAPGPGKQLRFLAGYTIERWWYLAQTYNIDNPSRGELTVQGIFLRAEWGF